MASEQSVMAVIRASRPSFKNPHDRIAFSIHAAFLASGYVLHATGPASFSENALSSPSTDEVGIDHWNDLEDEFAFIYSNPSNGSKKVLVKCLAMNNKLLVDALAEDGLEPLHLELNVEDYAGENGGSNYASQYKNLDKLVSVMEKEMLSKLGGASTRPASGSAAQPLSSSPSGTKDVEIQSSSPSREPYSSGIRYPPIAPGGGSNLVPGPGAGVYPMVPGRDDFGVGGGMYVGPDHPMFGRIGREPGFPGAPPGIGLPPGARFDPYGPPGVPGFEPNRFGRNSRRPGGNNHPDLQPFGDGSDYI